jgi:hypothetical protein
MGACIALALGSRPLVKIQSLQLVAHSALPMAAFTRF